MTTLVTFTIDDRLFLRDPDGTPLGRKILCDSIELIDELGFEAFTFKKLATRIRSTEASVYRYFASKHQMLQYLLAWYWSWVDHAIDRRTQNVADPRTRFHTALAFIAEAMENDPSTYVNEGKLHRIVLAESTKAETRADFDATQAAHIEGGFAIVVKRIAGLLAEAYPGTKFPRSTVVLAVSAIHRLTFFARLGGDIVELDDPEHDGRKIVDFVESLLFPQTNRSKEKPSRAPRKNTRKK